MTYKSIKGIFHLKFSIIEKLPLEKSYTYVIHFLRTGQVRNNFDGTVITTHDFRFNTYLLLHYNLDLIGKLSTICRPCLFRSDRKTVNHLQAMYI